MSFNNQALALGTELGEYRLEKVLGQGGFAITYLATDLNLDKQVAIKEYLPSDWAVRGQHSEVISKTSNVEKDFDWGKRTFVDEVKLLAKLDHPNIVRVYRFFEALGTAYIVMEHIEGGSLLDKLKDNSLNPESIVNLADSLSSGLDYIHSQNLEKEGEIATLIHRDISPDNILFRKDGSPVLIDFGAARQIVGGKSRAVSSIVKDGYAPMEQYGSAGKHMGPWTDIYALSAVLYECISGSRLPTSTDRLLDDSQTDNLVESFSDNYTFGFLQAITEGISVRPTERPKNVVEWKTYWKKRRPDTPVTPDAAPQPLKPVKVEITPEAPAPLMFDIKEGSCEALRVADNAELLAPKGGKKDSEPPTPPKVDIPPRPNENSRSTVHSLSEKAPLSQLNTTKEVPTEPVALTAEERAILQRDDVLLSAKLAITDKLYSTSQANSGSEEPKKPSLLDKVPHWVPLAFYLTLIGSYFVYLFFL